MIAQEWMINVNSGLIVLLRGVRLVPGGRACGGCTSILIGITISSVGPACSPDSRCRACFCILGILCFSVGEMLASPEDERVPRRDRPRGAEGALHGLRQHARWPSAGRIGSLLAGRSTTMGDKANLALRYLSEHHGITAGSPRTEAMVSCRRCSGRRGAGHRACCGTPTIRTSSGIRSPRSASSRPSASSSTRAGRRSTKPRTLDAGPHRHRPSRSAGAGGVFSGRAACTIRRESIRLSPGLRARCNFSACHLP